MANTIVIKGANFYTNRVDAIQYEGEHTTAITLTQSQISADSIGEEVQLSYVLTPFDSVDAVQWTSSDENVATVSSSGLVTIVGCGMCEITAISGQCSDSCDVTVEVELTGYTIEAGMTAKPLNSSNTVPGWICGINPSSGSVSYKVRAATISTDPTETRLTVDNSVMTDTGDSGTLKPVESRGGWAYLAFGWTVPLVLPTNCTKIKVYTLNSDYSSMPLFYKSNVVSSSYSGYVCYRKPTGWAFTSDTDVSNGPWTYGSMTEYDIPEGFDSVIVNWYIPASTETSPNFYNMTEEQRSAFKVVCC